MSLTTKVKVAKFSFLNEKSYNKTVIDFNFGRHYINITFPDMVIVENIIPRNLIINRGAAKVDNHILRDDIFDYHHIREGNIYFIVPNIRSFIFHCLRPTMVRGDPKGK